MDRCEIPLKLPSLNEYIDACRTNRFRAAKLKREAEQAIMIFIRHLPRYNNPVYVHFEWIVENKRSDYDNIAFAKKFVLDALVKADKIPDDGQRYVRGFSDTFRNGNSAGVIITIVGV